MNEGAAFRVLSFLTDSSQRHVDTLINERRKVNVIGEEHEPDELAEDTLQPALDSEVDLLPPEKVKEFFKAVEGGSIERLEDLFDTTANADTNMTEYTESLLMAAIRAQRYKVAEYLIDQLGVNVNHTSELLEFRPHTKIPVRERTISCRDLAYDRGMMELVDLIDIASDDVRPSVKRYLQRRLRTRLDQIHQSFLKRMKERTNRLIDQLEEKENRILEEDEQEKETEESIATIAAESTNQYQLLPPPPVIPIVPRQYKSHIEETIQRIQSKNDKSIDETGQKMFRFSGYTLRYRLVETGSQKQQTKEQSRPKTGLFSFPMVPNTSIKSSEPSPLLLPPVIARPGTTATVITLNNRSTSEVSARIPVRDTRTSICRSARSGATSRTAPTAHSDNKSEIILPTTLSTTTVPVTATHVINPTKRLLPKRTRRMNTENYYFPQLQHAVYNDPRHFMPVTLKATAVGLPTNTRIIRD